MGLTYLSGRPGLLLTSFVLLAYVGVALAPFRWAPPRRHANAAAAGADGIRFPSAGLAHSAAPPGWLERAATLGALRLELRLQTYALDQAGPSRIFTVSRDLHFADLTVGQEGSDLLLLLRRPGSAPNGKPAYSVPGVFLGAEYDFAARKLYVPAHHYLRVRVRGDEVQVTAVLLEGGTIETTTLAPRGERALQAGIAPPLVDDRWLPKVPRKYVLWAGGALALAAGILLRRKRIVR
jgi:hypothetical protein